MARAHDARKRNWRFPLRDGTTLEVAIPPRATEKQVRRRGRWSVAVGALIAAVMFITAASADNLNDTLAAGSVTDPTINEGVSFSTTISYQIQKTGANNTTFPATVDFALNGAPSWVSLSATTRTFGDYSDAESITVSGTAPSGSGGTTYNFSVDPSTSASNLNTTPAKVEMSVTVIAPSDTIAPSITCTPPNDTVWYADDVAVPCTASDEGSGLANPADASFSLATSVATGSETSSASTNTRQVCDVAGNCATAGPYTFMVDRKAPQLASCDAPDGQWHAVNVTLQCSYTDGGSGPAVQAVDLSTSVPAGSETADAAASANGAQACDSVGNCADAPADIGGNMIDRKAPTITCETPAPVFILGQLPAEVTGVATDGGSGPATQNLTAAADTSSVLGNPKSVDLSAQDNVGNSTTEACSYSVVYDFSGFFRPIDNLPAYNVAKAGQAVPVKFSLGGDQGLAILAADYPKWKFVTCDPSIPQDGVEETMTAGHSSLTYDPVANQYVYVWKTDKAWAGKCMTLEVKLVDGTSHYANFKFSK